MLQSNYSTADELKRDIIRLKIKEYKREKRIKTVVWTFILLLGILSLVFSFYCLFSNVHFYNSMRHTAYEYYGGDAYTGIQQAVADVSRNVEVLGDKMSYIQDNVSYFSFCVLFVMGLTMFIFGIAMLYKVNGCKVLPDISNIDALVFYYSDRITKPISQMKFYCPACNSIIESGASSCPKCGQEFKWG